MRKHWGALLLLDEPRRMGFQLEVITSNAVISACGVGGMELTALRLEVKRRQGLQHGVIIPCGKSAAATPARSSFALRGLRQGFSSRGSAASGAPAQSPRACLNQSYGQVHQVTIVGFA